MSTADLISQLMNDAAPLFALAICAWAVVAIVKGWRAGKVAAQSPPQALLEPVEQRLQRLEQTTEAIALEVERIAEGQRFVTKILSNVEHQPERLGAPR